MGDGQQTRDFTYVTDVANAVLEATLSDVSGEILNVGSGQTVSINKIVELLEGDVLYIPKRPGEPECTFADITKISSMLNWNPIVTIENGVDRVLENIDYWRDAVVWTPKTINEATKDWFKFLA